MPSKIVLGLVKKTAHTGEPLALRSQVGDLFLLFLIVCRKDKARVKQKAEALIQKGKALDESKYIELLWGDNLQIVCIFCHDLKRGKVAVTDEDLLKSEEH
jgi:hypothetical protein